MIEAPLPAYEAERLAALRRYQVLDTAAETEFDALTQLAAAICGTSLALLRFVDEHRVWHKAQVGYAPPETPRATSFSAHAILHPEELLIVPDMTQDARFADNPNVVAKPHFRFFAGMPLVNREGFALGTLCVFDQQPLALDEAQQAALRLLARQVVTQLELRRARAELERSHQEIQHQAGEIGDLYDQAPCGYHSLNAEGVFVRINDTELNWLGYTREEVVGKKRLTEFMTPASQPIFHQHFPRLITGGSVHSIEFELLRRDGTSFPIMLNATAIMDEAGRFVASRSTLFDMTEKRRFEQWQAQYLDELELRVRARTAELEEQVAERRKAEEQLRRLSNRLVEVQEAERRHLARELHDEVGQLLTGLKMLLKMSATLSGPAGQQSLTQARDLVGELMTKVRNLSLELRPGMLDDMGLLPALHWLLERYEAQTSLRVGFIHAGLEGQRFAPQIETAAYRITQEALTNVARYAETQEAALRLWTDETTLHLQVEDRGCGFDLFAASNAGRSSGLAGMRERAQLLGGRVHIESAPGAGTTVLAEFPLRKAEARGVSA